MKHIRRLATLAAAASVLLLAANCTSELGGRQPDTDPAALERIKTLDDALLAFGAPNNIAPVGNDRVYYFVSSRTTGGGVGLGTIFWQPLVFSRDHLARTTMMVRVDPDGRVVALKTLDAQPIRRSSVWPFD